MKAIIYNIGRSAFARALGVLGVTLGATYVAGFSAPSTLMAQVDEESTATTETVESAGTVSEFGPDTITIRTERSAEPVPFSYTKTTTYVDENGVPVSREVVKTGLPVTVYYVKEGGRMVASRVVVRRAAAAPPPATVIEKKTTTTTTTDK